MIRAVSQHLAHVIDRMDLRLQLHAKKQQRQEQREQCATAINHALIEV